MKTNDLKQTWRDAPVWGATLLAGFLLLAALPLVLAYLANPSSGEPLLVALGLDAGLLGFSLLVLQFVLSARIPILERPFGLDAVMGFHKSMGILAGVLILLHPILIALGDGSWSLFRLDTPWPITLGKVAFVLLVLTILLALFFAHVGMDYNVWRVFHKGAILVVFLGFIHALLVGPDLQSSEMRAYWITLFAVAVLLFLFRNVYIPLWGRRRFRVAAVERESHDTWTLAFEPEDDTLLVNRPGQFWFVSLKRPGRRSEQHPFTISSSPTSARGLTSTIKESGNFTQTIGQTQPGDKALIEGPFGRFSLVNYPAQAFLFIAGGVGITPIISMLRYLCDTNDTRPAVLIYGNKTENDILFKNELSDMSGHVKVVHILSSPEAGWEGPKGYIATDVIRSEASPLLEKADVFLCGPPVMMKKVLQSLKQLDVPGVRTHYERFTI